MDCRACCGCFGFVWPASRIMVRMSKKKQGKRAKRAAQEIKPFTFADCYDLAVVGGGAAGLACALSCAQEAQRLGGRMPRIIVLEKGRRIGASILRSGNGRCNFSNSQLQVGEYHNAGFVAESLAALAGEAEGLCLAGVPGSPALGSLSGSDVLSGSANLGGFGSQGSDCSGSAPGASDFGEGLAAPVVHWLEQLGLVWEEAPGTGGLLYPFSNKASSVLEVLVSALQQFNVDLRVCVEVDAIGSVKDDFYLSLSQVLPQSGQTRSGSSVAGSDKGGAADSPCPQRAHIQATRVAFAPGGAFDPSLLEGIGLGAFEPWQPVLGPLAVRFPAGADSGQLDGIRARARVSVPEAGFTEIGEVLFREYGLSGIVVFNASRRVAPGLKLYLDFLPDVSAESAETMLARRAQLFSGGTNLALFRGFLLPELAEAICAAAGVSPATTANEADARLLATALKRFPCTVEGIADAGQCQVHRGGVSVSAVDSGTMECASAPGLYLLGEALDVDGPCGGYNLHWAWSSGILTGLDVARLFAKGTQC